MPPQEEIKEPSTNTQEEIDDNLDVSSMLEDIEIGSGCVADMQKTANPIPSQKELQIQDILDSPMLNKAKELFDVKKITVRPKT
jgi:DNA polymerase-3 subunit gamma/tau